MIVEDRAVRELIGRLALVPHPEGGFYAEAYRAAEVVTTGDGRVRRAATAIYFLLAGDAFSAFHRLRADETWHFYAGDSIAIEIIDPAGRHETRLLGPRGPWQMSVSAGCYFGSHVPAAGSPPAPGTRYALVGCTVAPGFEFEDFEMPGRAELAARFPQHRSLIERLTRERA